MEEAKETVSELKDSTLLETFVRPNDPHFGYKVVFLGDAGVGKSWLVRRFTEEMYDNSLSTTISFTFAAKNIEIPEIKKSIKLNIWDTTGEERYKSLTKQYFHGSNAIVLCYDTTTKDSFAHLDDWEELVNEWLDPLEYRLFYCGCKSDLNKSREVDIREAAKGAKSRGVRLFETSAEKNLGVDYMFKEIAKSLYENPPKVRKKDSLQISILPKKEYNSSYCCW